jgi:hypothetical protein
MAFVLAGAKHEFGRIFLGPRNLPDASAHGVFGFMPARSHQPEFLD